MAVTPAWAKKEPRSARVIEIHEKEYHAAPYGEFLTAHKLADYCTDPLIWEAKCRGEIVEGDKPYYAFGRAAHCYCLEGSEEFERQYLVSDGPVNPKTGKPYGRDTQKFAAYLDEVLGDRELVTHDEFEVIRRMAQSIRNHPVAGHLFALGKPEVTIEGALHNVPVRSRVDWIDFSHKRVVDWKTCEDLGRFERTVHQYGYNLQLAFYRRMVMLLTGHAYSVHLVATEKKQPYRTGVWSLTEQTLMQADQVIDSKVPEIRHLITSDLPACGRFDVLQSL